MGIYDEFTTYKYCLKDYVESVTSPSRVKNMYNCPLCGSGTHKHKTGAFSIYDHGTKWMCHSCDEGGDIYDLIEKCEGITEPIEQLKRAKEFSGVVTYSSREPQSGSLSLIEKEKTDYTKFFERANKNIEKTDYHRGLTLETLNRFNVGYVENWQTPEYPHAPTSPRLIIPTSDYSYLARDTRAELTETQQAYSKIKVGETHIFNIEALQTAEKPIFVVEGEIDALSIIDVGGEAVGLGGTSKVNGLLDQIKKTNPKRQLIIAMDNDEAGEKASKKLSNELDKLGITYRCYNPCGKCKDANEALQKDREKLKQAVENAEKGLPEPLKDETEPSTTVKKESSKEPPPFMMPKKDLKGNVTGYTLSTPLLAKHVKQNLDYFFLDTVGKNPVIFLYNYDRGVYEICSEDRFKGIIGQFVSDFDESLSTAAVQREAYEKVKTDPDPAIRISAKQLNSDPNLINFENGILHLDTMELHPHDPKIISTIQIPCKWVGKEIATGCPVFTDYVNTLTSGDEEAIELLLQFMGLTISNIPGHKTKAALFLCGPGHTGKTRYVLLLQSLVGDRNYAAIELNALGNKFDRSAIFGKRLIGTADMSDVEVKEINLFKQLTGGDYIPIEFKYKDPFTAIYNGTMLFGCNEMPHFIGDKGDHVYDRILELPCLNVIPEEQRDGDIVEKMYAERESIVYYAVLALKRLIENGCRFKIPAVCIAQREKYKIENDSVRLFIEECTIPRDITACDSAIYKDPCTTGGIYKAYCRWCEENGERKHSSREFRKSLCSKFGVDNPAKLETKQHGNRYYDFTLSDEGKKYIDI